MSGDVVFGKEAEFKYTEEIGLGSHLQRSPKVTILVFITVNYSGVWLVEWWRAGVILWFCFRASTSGT